MRRWLAWNVFFRIHERIKGHSTFRILKDMEEADCLSPSELEELRARRLRELIAYCYAHVPYVRARMLECGLQPADIREPGDLPKLPLMRKAEVRKHRNALRSDIARDLTPLTTGGSTGEPLIFDVSRRRTASRVACRQRVSQWWGLSVGDPEFAVWGSPVELSREDWLRSIRDRLLSTQLLPAFEMNEPVMSRYLDIIQRRGCRQLFGYPSAIYLLCLHARKQGRNLRNLGVKAVFVTGEVLYPYQRELITEMFNCPVGNGYGGRDSGFIAHECPQGGMHVMADAVIMEIVDSDGRLAAPGEPGEIVVTDLYSHEFPFLRYATGDIAIASKRRCSCGRALPMLECIEGRSNDLVIAPDGRVMNSLALVYTVREIEGIEQFRIIQKTIDHFHVQIVQTSDFTPDHEARIRKGWTQLLRSPVRVTFEYLSQLPSDKSGKFRHVVSDMAGTRLEEMQA